jgi:hypothetical protein
MDQICLAVPVLPGKSNAARDFLRSLDHERHAEYDRSEQRIGITKEVWFLAPLPSGDHLVAYMESRISTAPWGDSPNHRTRLTCGSRHSLPKQPVWTSITLRQT